MSKENRICIDGMCVCIHFYKYTYIYKCFLFVNLTYRLLKIRLCSSSRDHKIQCWAITKQWRDDAAVPHVIFNRHLSKARMSHFVKCLLPSLIMSPPCLLYLHLSMRGLRYEESGRGKGIKDVQTEK